MDRIKQDQARLRVAASCVLALAGACASRQAPTRAYALTRTSTEAAGVNCARGGAKIDIGQDDNENGTLDHEEVRGEVYACNGPDGALVEASTLPAGSRGCPEGGLEVRTGTDHNGSGKLEPGEFETSYSCNGTANSSGGSEG